MRRDILYKYYTMMNLNIKKMIFFFIAFLLFGCGKEQITKEYLVGDWYCSLTEYESSEKNNNENFEKVTIDKAQYIETYKLINDMLYIEDENNKLKLFDVDTVVNNQRVDFPIIYKNNSILKVNQIYKKINKNKYILEIESETSINEQFYLRKKIVSSCEKAN